jgi:predicted ATPase
VIPVSSSPGPRALGVTQFVQGEPGPARRNLDKAVALYDPESHRALALRFGQEPLSACRAMLAPVLWLLGFVEQSARASEEGLASARAGGHFNTVAYAIFFGAMTSALFRRDFEALERQARALMTIAEEQGATFWIAAAAMAEGLTQVHRGESEQGLTRFSRAREDWRATGSRFYDPLFAAVLADLHLQGGRPGEGLPAIDEALALAHVSGELVWEAEIHRLRGELLLAASGIAEAGAPAAIGASNTAEAEACLVRALEIARRQAAKSLELRAATSLARLRQRRGERRAAADLLAPVYRGFTEGLDTPDLTEARALLDQLA